MAFSAKFIRAQLRFFKPLMENLSLEHIRQGQDKIGQLMEVIHRKSVNRNVIDFFYDVADLYSRFSSSKSRIHRRNYNLAVIY